MATLAPSIPKPNPLRRVASPIHTVLLLAALSAIAVRSVLYGNEMRSAGRIQIYERTMLFKWMGLAFVLLGVWWARTPMAVVLGERWGSAKDSIRDLGLRIAYSIVSTIFLSVLASTRQRC